MTKLRTLLFAIFVTLVPGVALAQCGPEPAVAKSTQGACLKAKKAEGAPVSYGFYRNKCQWWTTSQTILKACGVPFTREAAARGQQQIWKDAKGRERIINRPTSYRSCMANNKVLQYPEEQAREHCVRLAQRRGWKIN